MFNAQIVADSKNLFGDRITTFVVTFPRFILAEFNTHRMFSRNSASSRAIPFPKLLESVKHNPFVPMGWQKNHSGMQGTEYITERDDVIRLNNMWLEARWWAMENAEKMFSKGVTKQICNRMLEAYMWHTCIVTATEWENFFALRCPNYEVENLAGKKSYWRSKNDFYRANASPGDEMMEATDLDWLQMNKGLGEIHIMQIAEMMYDAYNQSHPKTLLPGEWHIPFGDQIDQDLLAKLTYGKEPVDTWKDKIGINHYSVKVATTRCAQISYVIADSEGKPMDYLKMIDRHDKLAVDGHWSPFEHCNRSMDEYERWSHVRGRMQSNRRNIDASGPMQSIDNLRDIAGWSGNIRGFIQYRKMFENENIQKAI